MEINVIEVLIQGGGIGLAIFYGIQNSKQQERHETKVDQITAIHRQELLQQQAKQEELLKQTLATLNENLNVKRDLVAVNKKMVESNERVAQGQTSMVEKMNEVLIENLKR